MSVEHESGSDFSFPAARQSNRHTRFRKVRPICRAAGNENVVGGHRSTDMPLLTDLGGRSPTTNRNKMFGVFA